MSFKQVVNKLEDGRIKELIESCTDKDRSNYILSLCQEADDSSFLEDYYRVINSHEKKVTELVPAAWIKKIDEDLIRAQIPLFSIYNLKKEPKMIKVKKERRKFNILTFKFLLLFFTAIGIGYSAFLFLGMSSYLIVL